MNIGKLRHVLLNFADSFKLLNKHKPIYAKRRHWSLNYVLLLIALLPLPHSLRAVRTLVKRVMSYFNMMLPRQGANLCLPLFGRRPSC